MDLGETVIAAGIGCRKAISAAQIEAALQTALRHHALADTRLGLIAAPEVKGAEAGLRAAAAARGLLLRLIPQPLLEAANSRTLTRSARSMAAMNVHSVAEAAALAAAGPHARLLAPRIVVGPVTCALAEGDFSQ
jgi:cobalt-precorrin 5A hydrolase